MVVAFMLANTTRSGTETSIITTTTTSTTTTVTITTTTNTKKDLSLPTQEIEIHQTHVTANWFTYKLAET